MGAKPVLRVAVENDNEADPSAPALAQTQGAGWMAKCRAKSAQACQLAAAAVACLREASDSRSRCVLASYVCKNLLRRCGVRLRLEEEVNARLGGIEVTFRPLQGELYLFKEIFIDQVYEKHPAFCLRPGWRVFDVGANIGLFTLRAALCGAKQAFAFEPNPETFARLQVNLRRNRLSNVRAIAKAVGEVPRRAWLVPGATSTLAQMAAVPVCGASPNVEIEVTTLSAVLQQERILVVNLLKLDVEGAEAEVLRGAESELARVERIVMEYHSAELLAACERILRRHGFRRVLTASPAYAYFLGASVDL